LTSPVSSSLWPDLSWTRRPELERSWAEPPSELGPWSPPVGAGAGFGAGFGTLGVVGVGGGSGVVGAGTGVPGSWMSSSVDPGGTSTCTGTVSPEGSWTYTVCVWADAENVRAVRPATTRSPAESRRVTTRFFILAVPDPPSECGRRTRARARELSRPAAG
jgi:hypothetical protein